MAIITGNFPVGPDFSSGWYIRRMRKNDQNKWEFVDDSLGFLESDYVHACARQDPQSTGSYNKMRPGAWGVTVKGEPLPSVPSVVHSGPKVGYINPHFRQRQRRGEMIVSPYARSQVHISYKNGGLGVVEKSGKVSIDVIHQMRTYYGYSTSANDVFSRDGKELIRFHYDLPYKKYERRTITQEVTPFDVGWDDSYAKTVLYKMFQADEALKQSMWTNVLSEANSATADILTALAEAPKTLESIVQLIQSILKAFIAVKRKELVLLTKGKRVRSETQEKIKRNDYASNLEYVKARNEKTRKQIIARRNKNNKQFVNDMKAQLEEITNAVSQVWLTYRYGIMPNVYLIQDLVKAHESHDRIYNRWTDADSSVFSAASLDLPEGWSASGEISTVHRAFIKRRFDASRKVTRAAKEFSYDLLSTAWELVPLSFVVDWFLNIGDLIRSLAGNNLSSYEQVCTFSSKVDNSTLVFTHKESGCQVHATYSGYQRNVVSRPESYCTLLFKPYINAARSYDAIALSWSIFGKKFSKSLNLT